MSIAIGFREHEEFQRTALAMALGLPLLAAFLVWVSVSGTPLPILCAAMAVTAIHRFSLSDRARHIAWATILTAVTVVTFISKGSSWTGFIPFALLISFALSFGLSGKRLLFSLLGAASALFMARFGFEAVIGAQEFSQTPTWMVASLSGLAVSSAGVLALLPRHLQVSEQASSSKVLQLKPKLDEEMAVLVQQAQELCEQARQELSPDDPSLKLMEEGAERLMNSAESWGSCQVQSSKNAESLSARMNTLDEKIDSTQDQLAKDEYKQARQALSEQLSYLSDIRKNRERVVARMHHYLAAMERLRLAVAKLRSSQLGQGDSELTSLVDTLRDIGEDIDQCIPG